ncbi:MAG: ATP-dependent RecD-like DNA helicase [Ruminococcus sp.]|nr:ATP-dependent RecD-like DNA helicase [Ruminococcus sp.]
MAENKTETIRGEVDSIIFQSDDGEFCVVMMVCGDELINVVGPLGNVDEGEELECTGYYTTHQKFGEQFRCQVCERPMPRSAAAIQKYLSGGVIKGIGPAGAKAIVKRFGEDTLDVIENHPEKLVEVNGISEAKAKAISEHFKKNFAARTLMIFLAEYEISMSVGVKAYKKWGDDAEMLIRSNPYVLCSDNINVTFEKADSMARDLGIDANSTDRIKAGIRYQLKLQTYSGNTCYPLDKLKRDSCSYLNIESRLFDTVLVEELEEENIHSCDIDGVRYAMLHDYFRAENYISRRLSIMKECSFDNKIDFSDVIDNAEKKNGVEYDELQREAINLSLSYGFLVITGGPGTGKTTALNAIIDLYKQQGMTVFVAAPTGRAAKRLSDVTGCEAKTIHRMLEVKPTELGNMSFVHDENNMLDCDALIIDEMSMVDTLLFEAVLKSISLTCKLVLVGDSDQLPSVGAGNVLKDIIESDVMPVVRLTQIFRQAQQSAIITNAHKIVSGGHIDLTQKDNDFFFFQRLDYEGLQMLTAELCSKRLPKAYDYSPFEDIQVLSPTRKGPSGTMELNKLLQQELNPPADGKSEIKTKLYTFRTGDKVMQNHNDYEILWKKKVGDKTEEGAGIFNGDIGRIIKCNKVLRTLTIDFDGRIAEYTGEMLSYLELAYAITVHKSQGSEYDAVILTIFDGYEKLYYRNLLYTAVTRAKKLLIIIGQNRLVDYMIDNNRRDLRYTCLKYLLKELNGDADGQTSIF